MNRNEDEQEIEKRIGIIKDFVIGQIRGAIKHRKKFIALYPETKKILDKFKTNQIPELDPMPILDYVTCIQVKNRFQKCRAMSIALRSGIEEVKSLADVRETR